MTVFCFSLLCSSVEPHSRSLSRVSFVYACYGLEDRDSVSQGKASLGGTVALESYCQVMRGGHKRCIMSGARQPQNVSLTSVY